MKGLLIIILTMTMTLNCYSQKIEGNDISDLLIPLTPGFNDNIHISIDKEAKFIMCGELHGVPSNMTLKYQFLTHTYKNNNVRYLVIEAGPAAAYIANKYLSTGDESLLKFSIYYFSELEFWKALRVFNEERNPTDKIMVLGFDFDWIEVYSYVIKDILAAKPEYEENTNRIIRNLIDQLSNKPTDKNISGLNLKLKELINLKDSAFQNDISSNLITLDQLAGNEVPLTAQITRDKETYKNITQSIKHFTRGNFFAQYGISHVNKTRTSLTTLLHKSPESPFYGKVTSISRQYINCESKLGDKTEYVASRGLFSSLGTKFSDFDQMSTDIAYFKTDGVKNRKERLQSAVDYVIIVQNQK